MRVKRSRVIDTNIDYFDVDLVDISMYGLVTDVTRYRHCVFFQEVVESVCMLLGVTRKPIPVFFIDQ